MACESNLDDAAAREGVTLLPGDLERIERGMRDGVDGVARAVSELLRSRGALLGVVLKASADSGVPECLRDELRAALQKAVLR